MGPYFNFDAGVNFAQDLDISATIPGFGSGSAEFEFDPGFRVGLAGGYNFNEWVGAELETGFIYNQFEDFDESWIGHVPILANVILRYENPSPVIPYIGVGAGGAISILEDIDTETDFVFAWQGLAGVRFAVSETFSVGIGYKFFATAESEFDMDVVEYELDETFNHAISVNFNFSF